MSAQDPKICIAESRGAVRARYGRVKSTDTRPRGEQIQKELREEPLTPY
jgi:hypothetical protein